MTIDIRNTVRPEVCCLLCPGAEGVRLMVCDFLDPAVAKGFPDLSDLVGAGSNLKWHVLAFVEPGRTAAVVHVWEDP